MSWRNNTYNSTEIRRGLSEYSITNRQRNLYCRSRMLKVPDANDPRDWGNSNINITVGGGKLGWGTITWTKTDDRDNPFNGTVDVSGGTGGNTNVLCDDNSGSGISINKDNRIPDMGTSYEIQGTKDIWELGYATWNDAWIIPDKSLPVLESGIHIEFEINKRYGFPSPTMAWIDYELKEFVIKFIDRKPPPNETLLLAGGTKSDGMFVDSNMNVYEVKSLHLPATTSSQNNPISTHDTYELDMTLTDLYNQNVRFQGTPFTPLQTLGLNIVDGFMLDVEAIPINPAQMVNNSYDEDIYGEGDPANLEIKLTELRYNTVYVR